MGKNTFYEKDMGFEKFIAGMKAKAGTESVFIGYLRSSGTYKNKEDRRKTGAPYVPITLAQLAAVHEFGSRDGRIPERSFMRSAIANNSNKIELLVKKLCSKIISNEMTKKRALGVLGQFIADRMRARIDEGVPPPNAPSTIQRKGSDKPLVDTGQLQGAIQWEIEGGQK